MDTTDTTSKSTVRPQPQPQPAPRIPIALQNVFLQSNRGEEVHVPPPKRFASRIFHPIQLFRGIRPKQQRKQQQQQQQYKRNTKTATTTSPDRTTTATTTTTTTSGSTSNSSTSHSGDGDVNEAIIVEVVPTKKATTNQPQQPQPPQYQQDIVVVHPSTILKRDIALKVRRCVLVEKDNEKLFTTTAALYVPLTHFCMIAFTYMDTTGHTSVVFGCHVTIARIFHDQIFGITNGVL
jgi:hypothetical protein